MKKKIIRIIIVSVVSAMLCGCSPMLIALEKYNEYNVERADNIIINEKTGEPYYMEFAPAEEIELQFDDPAIIDINSYV